MDDDDAEEYGGGGGRSARVPWVGSARGGSGTPTMKPLSCRYIPGGRPPFGGPPSGARAYRLSLSGNWYIGVNLLRLGGGGGNPDDEDGAGDAFLAVAELLLEEAAFVYVELFFLGGGGMAAIVLLAYYWLCGLRKRIGLSFGSISEAIMKLEDYCWGFHSSYTVPGRRFASCQVDVRIAV